MDNLTFAQDGRRFNYRVAGLCVHDSHALLQQAVTDNFWCLPGGRCQHGEPSDVTLRRELQEELGVEVTIDRLLWIVENFNTNPGNYIHELGFIYLFDLPTSSPVLAKDRDHFGQEDEGLRLIFRWFPLPEIAGCRLYPMFLRTEIAHLPTSVRHLIHQDGDATASI